MDGRCYRWVVFRYGHHSPHSGYSRLAEYASSHYGGEIIRVARPLSRRIIRERMLWTLAAGTPGYDRASMAAELNVGWRILTNSPGLYHFLYGETTYRYTSRLNNHRGSRIVATFHLPPAGMRRALQVDEHLRRLSAAVCVGRNQQEFFTGVLDPARVFFVPLGVDTEFYCPRDGRDRDPDLCLFVGENYRDFPTLRGVVELVTYRRPSTRFVAVMPVGSQALVGQHPRLQFLTGVEEVNFLDLYRSAALMVLPLKDATANNALLEGLACGLPTVVTDVGATRDYVTEECGALVPPGDARAMTDAVLALLDSPEQRATASASARERALMFSWPKVIEELAPVYAAAYQS